MNISCLNCCYLETTESDGMICNHKNLSYLEDFLCIETMFCEKYEYNKCEICKKSYDIECVEYIESGKCLFGTNINDLPKY